MNKLRINKRQPDKERFTLTLETGRAIVRAPGHLTEKRSKVQEAWQNFSLVGDIGYAITLPIVGGAVLGAYIDRKLSLFPKVTLFFLFVGILVSASSILRILKDINKKKN